MNTGIRPISESSIKKFLVKRGLKKTEEQTHRVVILSDFGNTLIDFSSTPQQTDIHYVLEDLNRKMILKTLTDDFRIITNGSAGRVAV